MIFWLGNGRVLRLAASKSIEKFKNNKKVYTWIPAYSCVSFIMSLLFSIFFPRIEVFMMLFSSRPDSLIDMING